MDNRMSCWSMIQPNGNQICEFNTLNNNKYIVEFTRDKKYIDIFFKHKTIKGITNLFEQFEIFGLVSGIIKNYMEKRPEETYYRIKTNSKIILKIIKLVYKNHGYINNYDMIENDNEICFEKI